MYTQQDPRAELKTVLRNAPLHLLTSPVRQTAILTAGSAFGGTRTGFAVLKNGAQAPLLRERSRVRIITSPTCFEGKRQGGKVPPGRERAAAVKQLRASGEKKVYTASCFREQRSAEVSADPSCRVRLATPRFFPINYGVAEKIERTEK